MNLGEDMHEKMSLGFKLFIISFVEILSGFHDLPDAMMRTCPLDLIPVVFVQAPGCWGKPLSLQALICCSDPDRHL